MLSPKAKQKEPLEYFISFRKWLDKRDGYGPSLHSIVLSNHNTLI
jgi:hypothetical protein